MDERKGRLTKKENLKKASYELICEWVSETWREISTDLLARSFEASGIMLNPDGSEDYKMTSCLQAIVANRMNEVCFSEEEDNESNPDKVLDDELDSKSVMYDNPEKMD